MLPLLDPLRVCCVKRANIPEPLVNPPVKIVLVARTKRCRVPLPASGAPVVLSHILGLLKVRERLFVPIAQGGNIVLPKAPFHQMFALIVR